MDTKEMSNAVLDSDINKLCGIIYQLQAQNAQLTQQISNNYLTIESKQCVIESLTDERAELEGEVEQLTQKLEGVRAKF